MKKITHSGIAGTEIYDSTDYIKIEEDGQYLDDKYVDRNGKKYNKYDDLLKGDLIVRILYGIYLSSYHNYYNIVFKKFRYYGRYNSIFKNTNKMAENLNTKNSIFVDNDFNIAKNRILNIFKKEMKIEIE